MPRTSNTVYPLHTRRRAPATAAAGKWHARIADLKARDYAFLGFRYSEDGFVFRGLSDGLSALLREGRLGHLHCDRPQARLEAELGVFFLSHEPSDALALARLWEGSADAGVVVLPARSFNDALDRGEAAVLGLADPGMVFKYPFLVHAPEPAAIHCVVAADRPNAAMSHGTLPVLHTAWAADRAVCERQFETLLVDNGIAPSQPLPCRERP